MLKKKAYRKIIITTFSIITMIIICIIPNNLKMKDNYLNPNIDTILVTNLNTADIYLLSNNNYLTKVNVILNEKDTKEEIKTIIEYLTIDKSNKLPVGLSGTIPKDTILNGIDIENKIATLDFSDKLLKTTKEKERKIIESLTYSIIEIDGIEGIKIKINNELLTKLPQTNEVLPNVLNRNFGINKVYEIQDLKDIDKVILYYVNEINDTKYYVPVTKYLNDDREKIKIIIDNLSSNYIYEPTLLSLLNQKAKLMNYEIEDDKMNLNFSSNILFNDKILEEVIYQVTQSVFENYDVNSISIKVEGKEYIEKIR